MLAILGEGDRSTFFQSTSWNFTGAYCLKEKDSLDNRDKEEEPFLSLDLGLVMSLIGLPLYLNGEFSPKFNGMVFLIFLKFEGKITDYCFLLLVRSNFKLRWAS